jgi:lactoylglutathione lyase
MKFSQARLLVEDFPAAFRFYREVLGVEPSFGDENAGYASFDTGAGTVAIFRRDEQAGVVELRPPGDGTLLVLEVEDAAALAERWREHVVAGPTERRDWGGRVVHLRDPGGNLIELFEGIPMDDA